MEILKFIYAENEIEFLVGSNIMVNATEMAKIFDKQVVAFMRNESTILFISECLKSENSHFLSIKNEEDLINSKQKTGTYMHRILALKFAAWLNPAFELWVYITIDKILNKHVSKMKEIAEERKIIVSKITETKNKLLQNEDFIEYQKLIDENKKLDSKHNSAIRNISLQYKLNF